jgi:hypothetical protein
MLGTARGSGPVEAIFVTRAGELRASAKFDAARRGHPCLLVTAFVGAAGRGIREQTSG